MDRAVDADPAGILRVVSSRPEEPVVSQQVRDKVVAPLVASTTEGNLAQTVLVNAHEVPDKVVFATDAPLGPIAKTIAAVEKLGLSAEVREKIMAGNAKRLLRLD